MITPRIITLLLLFICPNLIVAGFTGFEPKQVPNTSGNKVQLYNSDFTDGTYRITRPGRYILTEDIIFNPQPAASINEIFTCCKPQPNQIANGDYPADAYGLGFFAAITIECDGVELDLNGKRMDQSPEHALLQRFFSLIELADSPFIAGEGPHDFTTSISSAKNVYIHSGTLGRSSHHGIHGNGNQNIHIENVDFDGFEVAAAALNGVDGYLVEHCTAKNRKDVPVVGLFSAALFILPYVRALDEVDITLRVQGVVKTVGEILHTLEQCIEHVYVDVRDEFFINNSSHPLEYALFANPKRVIEGNAYGFLTNHIGVAVNGFPHKPDAGGVPSNDVTFRDVKVLDLEASILEIVALRQSSTSPAAINDPVGSVFQIRNVHPDTSLPLTISSLEEDEDPEYTGNPVSNAQVLVAKAIETNVFPESLSMLSTKRNKINMDIVNWVEAGGTANDARKLSDLLGKLSGAALPREGYLCNGDSMFHVNKGVIGFKIDGTKNFDMTYCEVANAKNSGSPGSSICGPYQISHPLAAASTPGYYGSDIRGFTFAGSEQGTVRQCDARNLLSECGTVVGFDICTDSTDITLLECTEEGLHSRGGGGLNPLNRLDACGAILGPETSSCTVTEACFYPTIAEHGTTDMVRDEGVSNIITSSIC